MNQISQINQNMIVVATYKSNVAVCCATNTLTTLTANRLQYVTSQTSQDPTQHVQLAKTSTNQRQQTGHLHIFASKVANC